MHLQLQTSSSSMTMWQSHDDGWNCATGTASHFKTAPCQCSGGIGTKTLMCAGDASGYTPFTQCWVDTIPGGDDLDAYLTSRLGLTFDDFTCEGVCCALFDSYRTAGTSSSGGYGGGSAYKERWCGCAADTTSEDYEFRAEAPSSSGGITTISQTSPAGGPSVSAGAQTPAPTTLTCKNTD